jgi:integrase
VFVAIGVGNHIDSVADARSLQCEPQRLLPLWRCFSLQLQYLLGGDGGYLRSVLRLIVILAYRCGLRRCEVLYLLLEDRDAADHLHVRNNDLRDAKTKNSGQSIPAGILLSPRELSELKAFLDQRKQAPRNGEYALLFSSKRDASAALDPDHLMRQIHIAMRTALKDPSPKSITPAQFRAPGDRQASAEYDLVRARIYETPSQDTRMAIPWLRTRGEGGMSKESTKCSR